jgi:hypothetical protein
MSPTEREYLKMFGPARHADTASLIDLVIELQYSVPSSECCCDVDYRCPAHEHAWIVAERLHRLRKVWRRK